ncbi:hypothetical protein ACHAPO_004142 [Fusarium lateritium]
MLSITYEIDPGGDIELVLNKPNNQKIVPVLRFTQDVSDPDNTESDDTILLNDEELSDEELNDPSFDNPPCDGRYSVFKELYPADETYVSPVDSEVRMRVSSRHLILASQTFKAMLEGPWSEGASSSQSVRQINTSEWDAMAFAIVLDIIHGRHRGIPEDMTLGLVTRIATIVDYYGFHEALYVYRKSWLSENLEVKAPTDELSDASLLCLYAAWVFSDKVTMSSMARLVLLYSEGLAQINTSDLPIGGILDVIEGQRQYLITESLQLLDALVEQLLEEKGCPVEQDSQCTALTLGVLLRSRHEIPVLSIPPEQPHNGYSVNFVLRAIADIEEPKELHSKNIKSRISKRITPPCSIKGRLAGSIESIQSEIWSLCMRDTLEKTLKGETSDRVYYNGIDLEVLRARCLDVLRRPLVTGIDVLDDIQLRRV